LKCLANVGFLTLVFLTTVPLGHAQNPRKKAWEILEASRKSQSSNDRVDAAHALGLLVANHCAATLAEEALVDKNPSVRAAAASALGQIGVTSSVPLLNEALNDKETSVVYAASNALILYGDPSGYEIYFEQLVGERKSGYGPLEAGSELIKDPKAMSLIALGVAVGFAPYAGYALAMVRVLAKDYKGPILVRATNILATDKDPRVADALLTAASSKKWRVRQAALSVIAHQTDPSLVDSILPHLSDRNHAVRCAAAAAVIQLSPLAATDLQECDANP
jgi:HEAT repeat protein